MSPSRTQIGGGPLVAHLVHMDQRVAAVSADGDPHTRILAIDLAPGNAVAGRRITLGGLAITLGGLAVALNP